MLDGVHVLDLSSVGPASRASRLLADYGASVVKVGAVPRAGAPARPEPPFHAYSGGRATRVVRLDLHSPGGVAAFLALARTADVVLESFRPGVAERLGVGFDAVRAENPGVVYCATSGYGQTGRYRDWAGHDLDYLAMAGFLGAGGRGAGGKPVLPGATVADSAGGGMHAVVAILAALLRRARTGEGAYLDVAATDGVLSLMALAVDEQLATGAAAEKGLGMLTGAYAWYDTYECADGAWVAVAAIEDRFFRNLCAGLGCDEWAERQHDPAAQDAMRAAFAAAFTTAPRDAWVARLAAGDTCVAPVRSVAEVAADPALAARGLVAEARHPRRGPIRQLAPLLAGTIAAARYELPDPCVTDTAALLEQAGYTPDDVARLRETGAIA